LIGCYKDLVDSVFRRLASPTLAKVYRETRFNKILPNNGSKLVYILINILKAYEVTEIEKRLVDLEKAHLKGDK